MDDVLPQAAAASTMNHIALVLCRENIQTPSKQTQSYSWKKQITSQPIFHRLFVDNHFLDSMNEGPWPYNDPKK